jgi:type IV pilus assembly protein PilQ
MRKNKPGILIALIIVLFFGCASHQPENLRGSGPKRITDILISKNSGSLIITIQANQPLTYTANKLVLPMGVLLHFPETRLDLDRSIYIPPGNEIISSIKAHESVENKKTRARLFFALKKDAPYTLNGGDKGITVMFPLTKAPSSVSTPPEILAPEKPPTKINQQGPPAANQLKSVTAKPLENNITVEVRADRAIEDYHSFTVDNPDRIVFDIYNLKSPHEQEQIIAVESRWVKRIRHFGHPDRVRLVIETHNNYSSRYWTNPTDKGLLIYVGKIPASSNQARQTASDAGSETGQVKLAWDDVPDATSYNVYWSASPVVTRQNGTKISGIKNPFATIKGLRPGATYYFVVTTVKGTAESQESEELSFTVPK